MAGLISKINFCTSMFLHLPIRTLEVRTEVLPGFSHVHSTDHFITTLLSQGCVLETASGNEKGKLNAQSKDRGGCDESPGVRVQLVGQTRDFPGSLMLSTTSICITRMLWN